MRITERPDIQLNREELLAAAEDWHFDRGAFPEFQEMYRALLPLLETEVTVAWESGTDRTVADSMAPGIDDTAAESRETPITDQSGAGCRYMEGQSAYCVVTLGPGIDRLQEQCGENGDVSDAYMLECLGSVLLQKAYDIVDKLIHRSTGLFVQRYIFPGDGELPLSENGRILRYIREADDARGAGRSSDSVIAGKNTGEKRAADVPAVSCNGSYVLMPQKSVVFLSVLGEDRKDRHLCDACPSVTCPNRKPGSGFSNTP